MNQVAREQLRLLDVMHREALCHAMVQVYASVLNRPQPGITLSPRHFLDCIHHFTALIQKKREAMEAQQRHLNIGLDRLKETVEQVETLRQDLDVKKEVLEKKSAEANEKLKRMVADQQEAQVKKSASLVIQVS